MRRGGFVSRSVFLGGGLRVLRAWVKINVWDGCETHVGARGRRVGEQSGGGDGERGGMGHEVGKVTYCLLLWR